LFILVAIFLSVVADPPQANVSTVVIDTLQVEASTLIYDPPYPGESVLSGAHSDTLVAPPGLTFLTVGPTTQPPVYREHGQIGFLRVSFYTPPRQSLRHPYPDQVLVIDEVLHRFEHPPTYIGSDFKCCTDPGNSPRSVWFTVDHLADLLGRTGYIGFLEDWGEFRFVRWNSPLEFVVAFGGYEIVIARQVSGDYRVTYETFVAPWD